MMVVVDASTLVAATCDRGPEGAWAEALLETSDLVLELLAIRLTWEVALLETSDGVCFAVQCGAELREVCLDSGSPIISPDSKRRRRTTTSFR